MNQRRTLTANTRRPSAPDQVPEASTAAAESAGGSACDNADLRRELIAVQAYLLAEARGFAPGGELDDWLTAETRVDAQLRAAPRIDADEHAS
jgi:hypothetical protein